MTDNAKDVGQRLKDLRLAAGYSQEALAGLVNAEMGSTWRQSTVWKIENGSRPLGLADTVALAEVFGLSSIDELLTGENDAHRRVRFNALHGQALALRFEEQALRVRLAEISAERQRVDDEMRNYSEEDDH